MARNFLQEYRKGMATLTKKVEMLEERNQVQSNKIIELGKENFELKQKLENYKRIDKNRGIDPLFSTIFQSVLGAIDLGKE